MFRYLINPYKNLSPQWAYALLIFIAFNQTEVFAAETKTKSTRPASSNASTTNVQTALDLYNQRKYAAAASAFEEVIKTATPSPTLYYYAALANQQSNKGGRATQLFNYIVSNFPTTREATYAQKMLQYKQSGSASTSSAENTELPESVKSRLPSDMQAMLNTDAGKQAVRQALKEQGAKVQVIRDAEKKGILDTDSADSAPALGATASKERIEHPFTAQDIARDGAGGIDQGRNPNCWFEASISALAQLPRGQRLLADTIRYRQGNKYMVRFHNDGVEYVITPEDLTKSGIRDKALWASLIECAQLKKFPDNAGANGADNDQSRLEVGLGSITGHQAEIVNPQSCDVQELSSFIGSAIKTKNPIVAATYPVTYLVSLPQIIVPSHAYTVIDFDPSKNIVTVRNPHGRKSRVYAAPANSTEIEFQQLGDGVVKLGLTTFQKYFHSVARSFI